VRTRLHGGAIRIPPGLRRCFSALPREELPAAATPAHEPRTSSSSSTSSSQSVSLSSSLPARNASRVPLLRSGACLEVAGTAGSGKTTLAMQVAAAALVCALEELVASRGGLSAVNTPSLEQVEDLLPDTVAPAVLWCNTDGKFDARRMLILVTQRVEASSTFATQGPSEVSRPRNEDESGAPGTAGSSDSSASRPLFFEQVALLALRLMIVSEVTTTEGLVHEIVFAIEPDLQRYAATERNVPVLLVLDSVNALNMFDEEVDIAPAERGQQHEPKSCWQKRDLVFQQIRRLVGEHNLSVIAVKQPQYSDQPDDKRLPSSYAALVTYAVFLADSWFDSGSAASDGKPISMLPDVYGALSPEFHARVLLPVPSVMPMAYTISTRGLSFDLT
jgi:hypothetical protein